MSTDNGNTVDTALQSFRKWAEGGEGFDELELKEALNKYYGEMMMELVGKDEATDNIHPSYLPEVKALNKLRGELRAKIKEKLS